MKPYDLILGNRFEEAIEVYNARISQSAVPDPLELNSRGTAFLCLQRYAEALGDFLTANDLHRKSLKGSGGLIDKVSVTNWLMGNREEAIRIGRRAVDELITREVGYTDLAGGAGPGLLLWYMAISMDESDQRDLALKYLENLAKGSRIKYWPGPLAEFAIGKIPFADALKRGTTRKYELTIENAEKDLLARRRFCQGLFYNGVKKLEGGDRIGFMDEMKLCYGLENPLIEMEWYLARHEVTNSEK